MGKVLDFPGSGDTPNQGGLLLSECQCPQGVQPTLPAASFSRLLQPLWSEGPGRCQDKYLPEAWGAQHPEALVQFPRAPEVKRTGAHGRSSPSPDFALVSSQGSNRRLPAFQKVRARGRIISSNRTVVYNVQRLTHKHPPTHTWVLPIVPGYGQSYIFPGFQIKNLKERGEACPSSSRWREPRRPAPRPHPFGPAVLGVAISVGGSQYSCAC